MEPQTSSLRWLRGQDLFLAQKIKVSLAAGTRIDDSGKVPRKIVGVTLVIQSKSKWDLQCDLRRPDEFALTPSLTVNRDFATGSNWVQKGFAVASK